ncbi:hypothetical protein [Paenibacillus tundrae]|uniref:hypothetical protein n=1 Tax=Paenibacillus tundrae TaxID=528187 RepID=UPI0030D0A65F
MGKISVTVQNHWSPVVLYFALDWDGGGHLETNRFNENQSETLSADIPEGANVTITIYKLIVGWSGIWEESFPVDQVPSCLKVTGLGDVSVC